MTDNIIIVKKESIRSSHQHSTLPNTLNLMLFCFVFIHFTMQLYKIKTMKKKYVKVVVYGHGKTFDALVENLQNIILQKGRVTLLRHLPPSYMGGVKGRRNVQLLLFCFSRLARVKREVFRECAAPHSRH